MCGKKWTAHIKAVRSGNTKSCGCLTVELKREASSTHGMSKSLFYTTWRSMKERCNTPNGGKNYYDKGIRVCERWWLFENFMEDMYSTWKPHMHIHRKDSNKGYEPSNCIWLTSEEHKREHGYKIEHNGKSQCITAWAEEYNIPMKTLYARVYERKWDFEKALTKPIGNNKGLKYKLLS